MSEGEDLSRFECSEVAPGWEKVVIVHQRSPQVQPSPDANLTGDAARWKTIKFVLSMAYGLALQVNRGGVAREVRHIWELYQNLQEQTEKEERERGNQA